MSTLISEYRRLTVGREALSALDAALALLERATGIQTRVRHGVLVISGIPTWTPPVASWQSLSVPVARDATVDEGHTLTLRPATGQRALRVRFIRTQWCLTILPPKLSQLRVPDTQYSFVIDCLLLLFHQAYFTLLPKLEAASLATERNTLVSAFFRFAEHVPDIAERFRITGLAHEARRDASRAVASFEKALLASHVDEHVFMTRLQTLWMTLLDKKDFEPALQLLLKVMLMVPLKHLGELKELILSTFSEYRDARANGRVAG